MEKNLFRKALLAFAVSASFSASAQLAMTRTTLPASYSAISTSAGATVSTATGNDATQTLIPIGFTFNYLGTNYTTIGVSTNGFAAFTGMGPAPLNGELYETSGPATTLAPWWDDLDVDNPNASILYQLQGLPGSRTFTVQWTNVRSYANSASTRLNFQLMLFEGSNAIEFHYGNIVVGTSDTLESASIGLKSAVGGTGQYLDAATGSAFSGNGMLSAMDDWPACTFRFSPGAPAAVPAGTYTVGNGGNYPSLSEAVADLNHRGVAGPVTLELTDSLYDQTVAHGKNWFPVIIGPVAGTSMTSQLVIRPTTGERAVIKSPGSLGGTCVNQVNPLAIRNFTEPVLAVMGGQHISVSDVTLTMSSAIVDRGLLVLNSSPSLGAQHCTFSGIEVVLFRNNLNTIGIEQRVVSAPLMSSGANSFNVYENLNIRNTYSGIRLLGNPDFPDSSNTIGGASSDSVNFIGGISPNDLGNGWIDAYGIYTDHQSNLAVRHNHVRNIGTFLGGNSYGIVALNTHGVSDINNNYIYGIRNNDLTLTGEVVGMMISVADSGSNTLRVYNNVINSLTSSYNAAPTNIRQMKGFSVQPLGGGAGSTINIDFNSVYMDTSSVLISNTCLELGTETGPVVHVRNNIFANMTKAQTSPCGHFCCVSNATNVVGNTGSTWNNNVFYVGNTAEGYAGAGGVTNYASLDDWRTAMLQDVNSVDIDPQFNSSQDLHVNNISLNGMGINLPWVMNDIDNEPRGAFPDIGADEFNVLIDVGAVSLTSPLTTGCYSASQPVVVRIQNFSNASHSFVVDPVTVTVNVTGAITQTMSVTVNNNTLNGGNPLAPNATLDIPVGTINMTGEGTYSFTAWTATVNDAAASNDTLSGVNVVYSTGTVSVSDSTVCSGDLITLSVTGNTGSTIQWQSSADGGNTWVNETGAGNTSSPYTTLATGPMMYRIMMCNGTSGQGIMVWVDSVPTAGFTYTMSGGTITFTDISTGGTGYSWTFGDNSSSTMQQPVHTYMTNGTFQVMQIVTNNCGSDTATAEITVTTVDVADISGDNGISIYPNPASGQFTVTLAAGHEKVAVELTDMQGKVLQRQDLEDVNAGTAFRMNVENYEQGVYFLRIISAGNTSVFRVVVGE